MPQTIRSEFHSTTASILAAEVQLLKANYYYYIGKLDPWALDDVAPANLPILSQHEDDKIRENIIYMKKISPNDVSLAAARHNWTADTIYDRWDSNVAMANKIFFVTNSEQRVYKCLDNNNGAISTHEPTAVNYGVFETSDGYLWKYMFTIPAFKRLKFTGIKYIPVQRAVSDSFYNRGSIEEIVVEGGGSGYTAETPTVISITGTTTGSGATATFTTDPIGRILTAVVVVGGTGYTAGAKISISTLTGSGAILTPVISGGVVTALTITSAGIGYNAVSDIVNIYVGGAIILPVMSSLGSIIGITIINSGAGYTVAPTLTVTGIPASGVGLYAGNATAVLDAVVNLGSIARVLIRDPGINYPAAPNTLIIAGDGTGAAGTLVVYGGEVVDVVMQSTGSGYSFADLSINSAGTGAILRANLGQGDYVSDQSIVEQTTVPGAIYATRIDNPGENYTITTVVTISGDGVGATAVPVIIDGSISRLRMTNYGSGYTYATIAFTDMNRLSGAGIQNADASVIYGPLRGHGFDAISELGSDTLAISTVLQADQALVSIMQDYRQFGIVRNPTGIVDEQFVKIDSELICFTVRLNTTVGLVKDEVLYSGNYRYRVASFDTTNAYLQSLSKKYVDPSAIPYLISEDNLRTYTVINTVGFPTINKYSGSLLLLSNEQPFQFTTEQRIAIKTYITL